ncbi:MAG: transketolase, partial [Anaerolineaceae bacterium]|nr:transketolase [Anaerolineaceae bacterium]
EAGKQLAAQGTSVRLVSFPSWELFAQQGQEYQDRVLPPQIKARLAVEAGVPQGWDRWVGPDGKIIGVETFGASAPFKVVYEKYGFSVDNVLQQARELLGTPAKA